jgi:uncharacterized protein (DUF362 family)
MRPLLIDELQKHLTLPIDRRSFLRRNAGLLLWAAALASGLKLPRLVWASGVPDIAIAQGAPGPAARAAVDLLGGMSHFVKPGHKVVIKPNMSFAGGPDDGTDTHPELVRELVAMCREAGAGRVRVLDHPLRREELCIEGVRKACEVFDEDIVQAVSRSRLFATAPIVQGQQMKTTEVMGEVLEADVLIAAPVAKSHSGAGVSLSMKGMMGLIWDRGVMHRRFDLQEAIVDLASLLRPALVVVDGTRVLTSNGPSGPGAVLRADTVIAATDMVAADAQTVALFEWYGRKMQPRNVKHIRLAHERGLGRMDLENLQVKRVRAG